MNSRIQIAGILGFRATQRRSQGSQEGTSRPGKPGQNTHPKRKLAGTVAHQSLLIPNQIFLLWYEEVVLNIFILCRELVTLFLTFRTSTHREVLECRSAAAFKCIILLMHAKRNCGAAAFPVVVISFSLLLCDVGCFFVTQSHSIKVSRWSALVIFSSFFSSSVVLPRSLCKFLLVEPIFCGLWLC